MWGLFSLHSTCSQLDREKQRSFIWKWKTIQNPILRTVRCPFPNRFLTHNSCVFLNSKEKAEVTGKIIVSELFFIYALSKEERIKCWDIWAKFKLSTFVSFRKLIFTKETIYHTLHSTLHLLYNLILTTRLWGRPPSHWKWSLSGKPELETPALFYSRAHALNLNHRFQLWPH